MLYLQKDPIPSLSSVIKYFWLVDSQGENAINRQKIVPDGYPEIILHYKDPYRINISGSWQDQTQFLLAGQIKKHFYLENTGCTGMVGIKLQPWIASVLFDLDMSKITDRVVELNRDIFAFNELSQFENPAESFLTLVSLLEEMFSRKDYRTTPKQTAVSNATRFILEKKGAVEMEQLSEVAKTNERTLQRYFKSLIGLSPKFYCRVIRFSHIFQLVKEQHKNWLEITYHAGYYDQSHFIKNFKEFTGEEPETYGFSHENMANFFMDSQRP